MGWLSDFGSGLAKNGLKLLGGAIGGPAGALLTPMIAGALGVDDDEEAIKEAMKSDPDAYLKLQKIQSDETIQLRQLLTQEKLAEIDAESKNISSVNQTMRAETKSEKWPQYSWRPFVGFTYGLAFLVTTIFICVLAYNAIFEGKTESMVMIPQFIGSMAALFGVVMPILGVASHHRGKAKRVNLGENSASIMDKMKGKIAG